MRRRHEARNHELERTRRAERWDNFRPHRPAAGDPHDLDDHRVARLRHVLRALRSPVLRLSRAEPGQVGHADRIDRGPLRHDWRRELHRRFVHRPLHRDASLRLSRRPLRPPSDLHLVAPLVLGGQHHGRAPARRRRPELLAPRLRRWPRRRDGDHRRLFERACAQGPSRARLRGQPGDRLRLRADRLRPRLRSCPRRRSGSRVGAGLC